MANKIPPVRLNVSERKGHLSFGNTDVHYKRKAAVGSTNGGPPATKKKAETTKVIEELGDPSSNEMMGTLVINERRMRLA